MYCKKGVSEWRKPSREKKCCQRNISGNRKLSEMKMEGDGLNMKEWKYKIKGEGKITTKTDKITSNIDRTTSPPQKMKMKGAENEMHKGK